MAECPTLVEELEFKSLLADLSKYGVTYQTQALSQAKGYSFIAITDEQQLLELIQQINDKKLFAFDTECDSLDPLQTNLVGISICVQPGTSYYIPCGHMAIEMQINRDVVIERLKRVFEDETIKKYLQHTKFDELVLSQYGIEVKGVVFDTMIAAHLVTKDWQRVGLKYLSKYYLQEEMLTFADTVRKMDTKILPKFL